MAETNEVNTSTGSEESGFFSGFLRGLEKKKKKEAKPAEGRTHMAPEKEQEVEDRLSQTGFFTQFLNEQEKRHGKPPTKAQVQHLKEGVEAFAPDVGLKPDETDDFLKDFLAKADATQQEERGSKPISWQAAPLHFPQPIAKPKDERAQLEEWGFPTRDCPALTSLMLGDWKATLSLKNQAQKKLSFLALHDLFSEYLPSLEPLAAHKIVDMRKLLDAFETFLDNSPYNLFNEVIPLLVPLVISGAVGWEEFVVSIPELVGKEYTRSFLHTSIKTVLPCLSLKIIKWQHVLMLSRLFKRDADISSICSTIKKYPDAREQVQALITLAENHSSFKMQLQRLREFIPIYQTSMQTSSLLEMEARASERKNLDNIGYAILGFSSSIGKNVSWQELARTIQSVPATRGAVGLLLLGGSENLRNSLLRIFTLEQLTKDLSRVQLDDRQAQVAAILLSKMGHLVNTKERWDKILKKVLEFSAQCDLWAVEKGMPRINYAWTLAGMSPALLLDTLTAKGGFEMLVLSSMLYDKGKIRTADHLSRYAETFATKDFSVKSFEDMVFFFNLVAARPDEMKPAVKHFLADLLSQESSERLIELEVVEDELKKSFNRVINTKGLDQEMSYLIRQIAALLPLGPKANLAIQARHAAIELQTASCLLLDGIKNKIHSYPGKEDVLIVAAYLDFLNTGDIDGLKELWAKYSTAYTLKKEYANINAYELKLNFAKILDSRDQLVAKTKEITERLLKYLEALWSFEPGALKQKSDSLKQNLSLFGWKDRRSLNSIVKMLDRLIGYIEKNEKQKAALIIGDIHADCQTLLREAEGELKTELYFFDLFLDSLEQHVHPDVMRELKLESGDDLSTILDLIVQKTYSLISTHHSDVSLSEALVHLEEFKRTKNLEDLQNSLAYYTYAINYLNDEITQEFKKIFSARLHVSNKQLEDLVSPFYRGGQIFQLDQLITLLAQDTGEKNGKISKIISETPRPISTHLRDRFYARFGL